MAYRKCPRCELNYITDDREVCEICAREMAGEILGKEYCYICGRELEDDDYDICKDCKKLDFGANDDNY